MTIIPTSSGRILRVARAPPVSPANDSVRGAPERRLSSPPFPASNGGIGSREGSPVRRSDIPIGRLLTTVFERLRYIATGISDRLQEIAMHRHGHGHGGCSPWNNWEFAQG